LQGDFTYRFLLLDIDGVAYVNVTDLELDMEIALKT
jgi:hypothetical protein